MDMEDIPATTNFLDHGYWINFRELDSLELWIGKDKLRSRKNLLWWEQNF